MDEIKALLKKVLAADILILAYHIRAEKELKGVRSTSDFTREARELIERKASELLGRSR